MTLHITIHVILVIIQRAMRDNPWGKSRIEFGAAICRWNRSDYKSPRCINPLRDRDCQSDSMPHDLSRCRAIHHPRDTPTYPDVSWRSVWRIVCVAFRRIYTKVRRIVPTIGDVYGSLLPVLPPGADDSRKLCNCLCILLRYLRRRKRAGGQARKNDEISCRALRSRRCCLYSCSHVYATRLHACAATGSNIAPNSPVAKKKEQ